MRKIVATGRIPQELKLSCITPIFKKGERNNVGNYRPIGAMCFFEKILEKFIETNMKKYLEDHKVIPDLQYGFQPKKSTTILLQDFAEIVNPAPEQRKYVIIIWLDLSKAYDTCDYSILLNKFRDVGINLHILYDYFQHRTQKTKIGHVESDLIKIEEGLCQGGICSAGWFNLYTYDVKYLKMECELKMYADDSCIIAVHENLEIAVAMAQ